MIYVLARNTAHAEQMMKPLPLRGMAHTDVTVISDWNTLRERLAGVEHAVVLLLPGWSDAFSSASDVKTFIRSRRCALLTAAEAR